jgi:hypothetical protein
MFNWVKAFRAVICASAFVFAGQTQAAIIEISAVLTGAQEVPGPGDPNATGFATFQVDDVANTLFGSISFADIDGALTAAHIHFGTADVAGPVVIPLPIGAGTSPISVSTSASEALIDLLVLNPSQFYVNVHSVVFPAGAIRGQLATGRIPEPGTLMLVTIALLMVPAFKKRAR